MKKWITPLAIVLVLLLALGLLLPGVLPAVRTYQALTAFLEAEEMAMDLTATLSLGDNSYAIQAQLDRMAVGEKTVTALSRNGRAVYYANGLLFLENGRVYRLTEPTGEKLPLWKGILWLLRYGKVESTGSGYAVSLRGQQAREILNGLLPGMEHIVPEVDSLSLALVTKDNRLTEIRFRGSGWLGEDWKTSFSLEAFGNIGKVAGGRTIPEAVEKAIAAGNPSQAEPLTENLIRLFTAFLALEEQDSQAGKLTLSADCGSLTLDRTVDLICWQQEGKQIYSLQENGVGIYYCDGVFCDSQGRSLSLSGENASAVKLPEMLLALCLELTADCQETQGQYVYRFSLDGDTMEKLAYAIVPEAENLPVSLEEGTLEVILAQEQIRSLSIRIRGSLSILLTRLDVAIGGNLAFSEDPAPALPEAVKVALGVLAG